MLIYIIHMDNVTLIEEYEKALGLPIKSDGKYLDDIITPHCVRIFKWYMADYQQVDSVRTLRYFTHVVNANLLTAEYKRNYLDYKRYNDEI
jgi:hypothetical protein